MEAHAARSRPVGRRWRHALESRRVLAPLLIAPAVVFMALVVGVPFVWAIYLSFTDAIGGSLSGHWVGFDNFTNAWHDDRLRREREDQRVAERAPEVLVVPGVREVVEADPVARERAADRIREAEVDRPDERDTDDERHEHDRRGDEERREDAAALESMPPAPTDRSRARSVRFHGNPPILVD